MSQSIPIAPELITWARTRSGQSREELEKRFPKLALWETGETVPTYRELEKLAAKTHTPLGNFFLPGAPTIELSVPDFRTVRNVKVAGPSPGLVETIAVCRARQEWFRDYAIANNLDPVVISGSLSRFDDVVVTGRTLRALLDFEVEDRSELSTLDEVYRHLAEKLDELGILVMKNGIVGLNTHRKLNPEEFRGFALFDEYAPLIFVNGADVKAGHIFTLCHELVHIAIGESALTNSPTPELSLDEPLTDSIERWCNQVAAEILVPKNDLKSIFEREQSLSVEVHRLSRRYKASKYVILHSLKDAGQIDWQDFLAAYAELKDAWGDAPKARTKGGGDFYRSQLVRLGRRLSTALVADTLEGRTLYADAYRLLGSKKPATFERFARELGLR